MFLCSLLAHLSHYPQPLQTRLRYPVRRLAVSLVTRSRITPPPPERDIAPLALWLCSNAGAISSGLKHVDLVLQPNPSATFTVNAIAIHFAGVIFKGELYAAARQMRCRLANQAKHVAVNQHMDIRNVKPRADEATFDHQGNLEVEIAGNRHHIALRI